MRAVAATGILAALLVGAAWFEPAWADSITLAIDDYLPGNDPIATGVPTITFEDTGVGEVTITMDLTDLASGSEFVKEWYVNVALDPALFTSFTLVSGPSSAGYVLASSFNASDSNVKADGDGYFDIKFTFATSGAERFQADETIVWRLTETGLSASSFLLDSLPGGGNGTYLSAIHLCGAGEDGQDSLWIGATAVPEPGTLLLMGAGLLGGIAGTRRMRRRTRA